MLMSSPLCFTPRRLGALALISAATTLATSACLVQINVACSTNYQNPSDGCPDALTNLEQSHNLVAPSTDPPPPGWDSQQPESCLVIIQLKVHQNPEDPLSPCVNSGTAFNANLSGLIGAGSECDPGGGDPD